MRRLIMLLALTTATTVYGADNNDRFAPKGAGLISCSTFVEEHEKGSEAFIIFRGWIDGYITAVNQFTPDTFDITAWESTTFLAAVIDNHCRKHPDDSVLSVAMTLVDELYDDRVEQASDYVIAQVESQSVALYAATLVDVQNELNRQDLLDETATGSFTPATVAALREFQATRNLPQTGLPDEKTLWLLLEPLPIN